MQTHEHYDSFLFFITDGDGHNEFEACNILQEFVLKSSINHMTFAIGIGRGFKKETL